MATCPEFHIRCRLSRELFTALICINKNLISVNSLKALIGQYLFLFSQYMIDLLSGISDIFFVDSEVEHKFLTSDILGISNLEIEMKTTLKKPHET